MGKSLIFFILLISLTSIWNGNNEKEGRKIRYNLEITSPGKSQVTFNATVFLSGESFLVNDQPTPYTTTIEASDLECLLDATGPVRIVISSEGSRTESMLTSAYIKAERGEKRIMGM